MRYQRDSGSRAVDRGLNFLVETSAGRGVGGVQLRRHPPHAEPTAGSQRQGAEGTANRRKVRRACASLGQSQCER